MPKWKGKQTGCTQLVSEKNDTIGKCGLCEFQTNSSYALKLHMKFVHKKKANINMTHKWFFCSEIFDTEKEVDKHGRIHSVKKNKI